MMILTNTAVLVNAGRKDAPLRKALADWAEKARAADWRNIQDVRRTFPSADGVVIRRKGGAQIAATVFNIKGNAFRLIAVVDYAQSNIIIREVLTHVEYDDDAWKGRL
jgi:mRNA interferase HigB